MSISPEPVKVHFLDVVKELKIQCLDYELQSLIKCENYFNGKVFYDVGCYLGLWSMAAFFRGARFVVGFDPYPTEYIVRNLSIFGDHYRIMNCIVTDDDGLNNKDGSFRITLDKFYTETVCIQNIKEGYNIAKNDIEKEDILGPGFIKIDVEGTELDVLRGGQKILSKFRPHVLIESHDYMKEGRKEEIFDVFEKWDYDKPEFVTSIEDGRIYHIFYKSPGIKPLEPEIGPSNSGRMLDDILYKQHVVWQQHKQ